jgi:hypothetical protein
MKIKQLHAMVIRRKGFENISLGKGLAGKEVVERVRGSRERRQLGKFSPSKTSCSQFMPLLQYWASVEALCTPS